MTAAFPRATEIRSPTSIVPLSAFTRQVTGSSGALGSGQSSPAAQCLGNEILHRADGHHQHHALSLQKLCRECDGQALTRVADSARPLGNEALCERNRVRIAVRQREDRRSTAVAGYVNEAENLMGGLPPTAIRRDGRKQILFRGTVGPGRDHDADVHGSFLSTRACAAGVGEADNADRLCRVGPEPSSGQCGKATTARGTGR
jgi:hypothetical protein